MLAINFWSAALTRVSIHETGEAHSLGMIK